MFYENKEGYNFTTLDNLYKQSVSAKYNTGDFFSVVAGALPDVVEEYSRPIRHQIASSNNMLDGINRGLLGSTFISYNIYNKKYTTSQFKYFDNFRDFGRIGGNPIYNTNEIDDFKNTVGDFPNSKRHLHSTSKEGENDAQFYSVDPNAVIGSKNVKSLYSPNKVEDSLLPRQSKFVELKTGVMMMIEVHGQTNLSVGKTIFFDFHVAGESHGDNKDPYYTGKYLITDLSHNFSFTPKKEHTTAMTIVKDGYGTELEQNTNAREPGKRSKGMIIKPDFFVAQANTDV